MNKKFLIIAIILLAAGIAVYIFAMPKEKNNKIMEDNNNIQNQQTENSFDIQGMKVEILKEGSGEGAKTGDRIVVNYTGTFLDGIKFDSSLNEGREPFPYTLGQNMVIKGWELGLLGMKVGEKRKLTIPYELAYGEAGRPPVIPAKSTLIFEIDMLSIN